MNNQCEIVIIDNTTQRKRKCKNLFKFNILDKKCCRIHANSLYIKNIVKIQKVFKAYKLRKKINYFKLLPIELQHKIINYNRDSLYENKRNKKITEIILNKIDIFIKTYMIIPSQINYLFGSIEFFNENTHPNARYLINHTLYLFNLLHKYQFIIINQKRFYNYNYRTGNQISSMFFKFLMLREKILRYKKNIINIENYNYIYCIFNFKNMYLLR